MDNHADAQAMTETVEVTFDPTDRQAPIHLSMSPIVWAFARELALYLPAEITETRQWADALRNVIGSSDPDEDERRTARLVNWLWSTAVPRVQSRADRGGFGPMWADMIAAREWRHSESVSRHIADADPEAADLAYALSHVFPVPETKAVAYIVYVADAAAKLSDGWVKLNPTTVLAELANVPQVSSD